MLPDIAQHNTRYAVSGLGNPGGTGVLSRSYEDLHPDEFAHVVVWNGTMEANAQKADQRRPSLEPCEVQADYPKPKDGRPVAETILALLGRTKRPLTRKQICELSGFGAAVVDNAIYRMAADDLVLSCLVPNDQRQPGQKQWRRIYSLPLKTKEHAA